MSFASHTVEKWPQPSFWMITYLSIKISLATIITSNILPNMHGMITTDLVIRKSFILRWIWILITTQYWSSTKYLTYKLAPSLYLRGVVSRAISSFLILLLSIASLSASPLFFFFLFRFLFFLFLPVAYDDGSLPLERKLVESWLKSS